MLTVDGADRKRVRNPGDGDRYTIGGSGAFLEDVGAESVTIRRAGDSGSH